MIGDGTAPGEFGLTPVGIEQAPMAAHRALELTLPGLVEGLDQIDLVVPALGGGQHLVQHARLIDR